MSPPILMKRQKRAITSSKMFRSIWFGWLVLWCLTSLSTIFQLYLAVNFIGGGNWSTRRKPPSCRRSLTSLIWSGRNGIMICDSQYGSNKCLKEFHFKCRKCFSYTFLWLKDGQDENNMSSKDVGGTNVLKVALKVHNHYPK